MQMEIGVDIIENDRFSADILADEAFMSRYFTEEERKYCFSQYSPKEHFAARFAAKEAVIKALCGFGIRAKLWDIEIRNSIYNTLNVIVSNTPKLEGKSLEIKTSISHDETQSIAFVIITQL